MPNESLAYHVVEMGVDQKAVVSGVTSVDVHVNIVSTSANCNACWGVHRQRRFIVHLAANPGFTFTQEAYGMEQTGLPNHIHWLPALDLPLFITTYASLFLNRNVCTRIIIRLVLA